MTDFEEYFTANNVPASRDYPEEVEDFPPDVRDTVLAFHRIWKFPVPGKGAKRFKLWIREAREINRVCGGEANVEKYMRRLFADWNKRLHNGNGYDVAGIQSISGMLAQEVAKEAAKGDARSRYTGGEYADAIQH